MCAAPAETWRSIRFAALSKSCERYSRSPARPGIPPPAPVAGKRASSTTKLEKPPWVLMRAATPEGTSISVTAQRHDGSVSLVVKDDGPGIGGHERARVFDRFYTGDRVSGSGLGLAIASELAVRMKGDLRLTSRRGRTEFTLRLPAPVGGGASA